MFVPVRLLIKRDVVLTGLVIKTEKRVQAKLLVNKFIIH